jgi:Tfp pilus assembly protein PilF
LTDVSERPPTNDADALLHVTVRVGDRPISARNGAGAFGEAPVPVNARREGAGWVLDGPEGPVPLASDAPVRVKRGDVVTEIGLAPRVRFPRFARDAGDLVLPAILLATTLLTLQLALLARIFAPQEDGGGAQGWEPSPELLGRLLEDQFDGAEKGVLARPSERPQTGDAIESFYLQPGHDGPKDRIGGGRRVGKAIRDGDSKARKVEEQEPTPVADAAADAVAEPLPADVPPATPVEEREEKGDDTPIAVHVTEGWGLTDWYDTQDARKDAADIRDQLKMARELLKIDPDDPTGLSLRAYYEYLAMDYAAALRTYEKLTTLYPEESAFWNNRALAYKREGKYQEEESYYRIALELDPLSDHAMNNLAVCLAHQGRYDEALRYMKELETLTPDDPYADLHRAKIYAAMGKEDRAYHFLEKSLRTMRKLDTLHSIEFRQDIRVDPALATLREQERFRALLMRYYGDQPGGWWNKGKAR